VYALNKLISGKNHGEPSWKPWYPVLLVNFLDMGNNGTKPLSG